jgi:DNA-binding NarL/FixJ family response regulator
LIVDDHLLVRDGLKLMLSLLHPDLHFNFTEAETGEEALYKINHQNFEMVIIDYQMPGFSGAETVVRMLRFRPEMKILALSSYDELSCIQAMMAAGAKGYVLKTVEPVEMLHAVKTILAGKIYYNSDVAVKLIDAGQTRELDNDQLDSMLTQRELEVLRLIAMEMTNDEIARKLFVAKRTVDTHRQNLINKLRVKNTVGLVKVALNMNLLAGD